VGKCVKRLVVAVLFMASPTLAQTRQQAPPAPATPGGTADPFPTPIPATEDVIEVNFREFAALPTWDTVATRMMLLIDEPGTGRMFVNDMRGPIYSVSYDGATVTEYVNVDAPQWGVIVDFQSRERGVQSFAFHPQFGQPGTPGYGKFYTWLDTRAKTPTPDFAPPGGDNTQDMILLEWTALNADSSVYDGGHPRELMRLEQPFANHNGGRIAFNPLAQLGDEDYGLLYMGVADGGSGGDPLNMAQDLSSPFGKIFRIDPLGSNSANGKYGIPASNPFANDGDGRTLGEIYAYGFRNPQRFSWDTETGAMYLTDIGQGIVEELDVVTRGGNYGWNVWEGSFRYVSRTEVSTLNQRSDPDMTYPIAEYGQIDPLFQNSSSITGVHVYRQDDIAELEDTILFGDIPSGEVFHVDADDLPEGGQDPIRRVLFNAGNGPKTLLQLIQEKNAQQGKAPATRADLRFGHGPNGQVFILNKADGVIRELVP